MCPTAGRSADLGTLRHPCAVTLFSYPLQPKIIIIGFGSHHDAYEIGREGVVPAAAFSARKAYLTGFFGRFLCEKTHSTTHKWRSVWLT